MWSIGIIATLQREDGSGERQQMEITERIAGWGGLEQWEQTVRGFGFRMMRELFVRGLLLLEAQLVPNWTHRDFDCRLVRRGRLGMTLSTVFGKVRFSRQRLLCQRCGTWLTPLNEVLSLHQDGNGRTTGGFRELACLCGAHHLRCRHLPSCWRTVGSPGSHHHCPE